MTPALKEFQDAAKAAFPAVTPKTVKLKTVKHKFYVLIEYRYSDDRVCFRVPTKARGLEVVKDIAEYNPQVDGGDLYWCACGSQEQDRITFSVHDILSITVVTENPLD